MIWYHYRVSEVKWFREKRTWHVDLCVNWTSKLLNSHEHIHLEHIPIYIYKWTTKPKHL